MDRALSAATQRDGDIVNGPVTSDEARRIVLEQGDADLLRLSLALDAKGESFAADVSARLVVDMLQVGEPETWELTTRSTRASAELFAPYSTMPKDDGKIYRSWLPSDMADDDEERVRAFANATQNEFVRARVFEILWSKFRRFPDANAAIVARLASASQCDAEKNWPRLVKNLGRLTTLTFSLNAKPHFEPVVLALEEGAAKVIACSRPFAFSALVDMVCNTITTKKSARAAFTAARANQWADRLKTIAETYRGDHLHGHDALMVLQAWHSRWGEPDAARTVRRQIVEHLRDAGKAGSAMLAARLHQRALQAALDFGEPDLVDAMRGELMASVKRSLPEFKRVEGSFTLPPELLTEIDQLLATSASLPAAIRQLSVFPGLLELDLARLREAALNQLRESPFLAFAPMVHYHHDGRVTFQSTDLESKVEQHVAFLAAGHLVQIEALLQYVLVHIQSRLDPTTMIAALAQWPHLPAHRAALLSVAAERFARNDWISSSFVVLPLYEAILRDLLRAAGYPAIKTEPGGVQMDETLNSLLRAEAGRAMLGDTHRDFVEYVLCEPALGWNLRNEAAHGTIRPDALSPMRAFLVWLLVVRITCFVAQPAKASDEADAGEQKNGDQSATNEDAAPV